MNPSFSCKEPLELIISQAIACHETHAKWLNALSYLENCGARKIAACQHPSLVKEETLKHAAEEFRHAYYLKKQIRRVSSNYLLNYSSQHVLGGLASIHYLNWLDLKTSAYLAKNRGLSKQLVKEKAYFLVTYAIELRASELYPLYDRLLKQHNSKVTVKSIVLEEQQHLKEMEEELTRLPFGMEEAQQICHIENELYRNWLNALLKEMKTNKSLLL